MKPPYKGVQDKIDMNPIKKIRNQLNFTQVILAKKTGLSLRTIQRLETSKKAPKGYTLEALATAFNMEISALKEKFQPKQINEDADRLSLKLINLSALTFFILPLGNIIVPLYVWNKKRDSLFVDEMGRKIINFQIIWTILLYFSLCISLFITPDFPLILVVLFLAIGINLVMFCLMANWINQGKFDKFNFPIQVL